MAEVILSRAARNDLVTIGDEGAARYGDAAADAYQEDFDIAFERLSRYPHSGPARPDFGPRIRSLVCNRHRILYRFDHDVVRILRILHHAQDVSRHLAP